MDWYHLVVFLHVAGVFGFLLAHGASASMLFHLRRERDPEKIRTLLDLSSASLSVLYFSLLLILGGGIVAGFMGSWWGHGWIWAALGVFIVLTVLMGTYGSFYYAKIRKAVGLPYFENFKPQPPAAPASAGELAAVLGSARPMWVAALGIGGLIVLLWLMIFKPF